MPNTVSFQTPSDYTAEQASIERHRALGQLLQQQSFANDSKLGDTQSVNGWAIKKSPWEGVNSLAQKALGVYSDSLADDRTKALGEALRDRTSQDFKKYIDLARGTEASDYIDPATQSGGQEGDRIAGGIAGTKGDRLAAAMFAMNSPSPVLQQMGAQAAAPYQLKKDETRYEIGQAPVTNAAPPAYHPPVNVTINGKTYSARYPKEGNGAPILSEAQLQTQFNAPTVDSTNRLAQADKQFNSLSAHQKAQLQYEAARLGISVQELILKHSAQNFAQDGAVPNITPPSIPNIPGVGIPYPNYTPPQAPRPAPVAPPAAAPAPLPAPAPAPKPYTRTDQVVAQDIAKKQAELRLKLPETIANTQLGIDTIDQLIGRTDPNGKPISNPHPGMSSLVGAGFPGLKYVPGSDTANAHALHKQIKGQTFLQAYDALRGGGQITEIEGEKATAARNRMDTAQSEADYIKAAREYQSYLRQGIQRARQAAGVGGERRVVDW